MEWKFIDYSTHPIYRFNLPQPRSGFQMMVNAKTESIYIYGGFAKLIHKNGLGSTTGPTSNQSQKDQLRKRYHGFGQRVPGGGDDISQPEGKVHIDMWELDMKPFLQSQDNLLHQHKDPYKVQYV